MKLIPTSGLIGGEIKGLSLSEPISNEDFGELQNFFYERSVVTHRDQSIDAKIFLDFQGYCFSEKASVSFQEYIQRRKELPFFANARSIRNAIDRSRLRQANRLFSRMGQMLSREELMTIEAEDILASRVFQGEVEGRDPSVP